MERILTAVYQNDLSLLESRLEAAVSLMGKVSPLLDYVKTNAETFSEKCVQGIEFAFISFMFVGFDSKTQQLKEAAHAAIVRTAEQISNVDNLLLPPLLSVLHTENEVAKIVTICQTIPYIIKHFSKDIAFGFLISDFVALSYHQDDDVRKESFICLFLLLDSFGAPADFEKYAANLDKLMDDKPILNDVLPKIILAVGRNYSVRKLEAKVLPYYVRELSSKEPNPELMTQLGTFIQILLEKVEDPEIFPNLKKLFACFFNLPFKSKVGMKTFASSFSRVMRQYNDEDWKLIQKGVVRVCTTSAININELKFQILRNLQKIAPKLSSEQVEEDILSIMKDYFISNNNLLETATVLVLPSFLKELHPITRE